MLLQVLRWPAVTGLILIGCQVFGTADSGYAQQTAPIRWPAGQESQNVANDVRFVAPTMPIRHTSEAPQQQPIFNYPGVYPGVVPAAYEVPVNDSNFVSPASHAERGENSVLTRRTQAVPPTPGRGPTAREPQVAGSSAANANARTLLMHAHELSQSAKNEAQFSNVIDACRQTLAAGPDEGLADYAAKLTSWALNRRGQIRSDEFRDEEALADFETAVRLDPSRWRAVHNRAVLLAQRGQFERAFDDFNYTIQLNPMFAKAYSNRAALFVHAGDMQSALRDYGRATSLDDSLAIAQRGSAKVCHLLGNLDRAITHYDIAVELDPNDPYTYVRRAELLIDMGHYAEADIDYDHAMQLDPQMAEAYRGSAWLLATCPDRRVRHGELAIERAERAIELRQDDDPHYFDTLAAAQASVGEFRDAAKSGNRAVALSTDTDRTAYEQRLQLYEDFQPYRTAPVQNVQQASYEQ